MESNNHYFDRLGICLKCDMCEDLECCPHTDEPCDNKNWEFISRMSEWAEKIKENRKNEVCIKRSER